MPRTWKSWGNECPACEGRGTVTKAEVAAGLLHDHGPAAKLPTSDDAYRCPDCAGTGRRLCECSDCSAHGEATVRALVRFRETAQRGMYRGLWLCDACAEDGMEEGEIGGVLDSFHAHETPYTRTRPIHPVLIVAAKLSYEMMRLRYRQHRGGQA